MARVFLGEETVVNGYAKEAQRASPTDPDDIKKSRTAQRRGGKGESKEFRTSLRTSELQNPTFTLTQACYVWWTNRKAPTCTRCFHWVFSGPEQSLPHWRHNRLRGQSSPPEVACWFRFRSRHPQLEREGAPAVQCNDCTCISFFISGRINVHRTHGLESKPTEKPVNSLPRL